jgi:V8-like Glu-specific endopeptidase
MTIRTLLATRRADLSTRPPRAARGLAASTAAAAVALLAFGMPPAEAAPLSVRASRTAATGSYWTPERLRAAKPFPAPSAAGSPTRRGEAAPLRGRSQTRPTGAPAAPEADGNVQLHAPMPLKSSGASTPRAAGPLGATFTDQREFPTGTLRGSYPWKTVGALFFTDADGVPFFCSASVVSRRVVATAGHCLYDAVLQRFHNNWFFVPGYDRGASPHGGFDWVFAEVTGGWAGGGGGVPNVSDFGVLVVADKVVASRLRRVGDLTGWLGWMLDDETPTTRRLTFGTDLLKSQRSKEGLD